MRRWLLRICSVFTVVAGICWTQPSRADEPQPLHRYEDDRLPPPQVRTKVLLAGGLLTGLFYAPALGASYLYPEHDGAGAMRIPIAGPWMALPQTELCNARPDNASCSNVLQITGAVLLVLDGIGQAGGLALLMQGLFMRTGATRAVRAASATRSVYASRTPYLDDTRSQRNTSPLTFTRDEFRVTAIPLVTSPSSFGLGLFGSF